MGKCGHKGGCYDDRTDDKTMVEDAGGARQEAHACPVSGHNRAAHLSAFGRDGPV